MLMNESTLHVYACSILSFTSQICCRMLIRFLSFLIGSSYLLAFKKKLF